MCECKRTGLQCIRHLQISNHKLIIKKRLYKQHIYLTRENRRKIALSKLKSWVFFNLLKCLNLIVINIIDFMMLNTNFNCHFDKINSIFLKTIRFIQTWHQLIIIKLFANPKRMMRPDCSPFLPPSFKNQHILSNFRYGKILC